MLTLTVAETLASDEHNTSTTTDNLDPGGSKVGWQKWQFKPAS